MLMGIAGSVDLQARASSDSSCQYSAVFYTVYLFVRSCRHAWWGCCQWKSNDNSSNLLAPNTGAKELSRLCWQPFRVTFACTSDYSSACYLNRNRAKWIYTVRYLSLPTLDEQRPVLTLTSSFETRLSHICGTAIRLKNGQSKLNFNDLRQFQIASLTQSIIA